LVLSLVSAQAPPSFEIQKLADGVYASIRREPVGLGVDANNLFIVDADGVVVVDTNFGASSTRHVIAALKKITNKPVRYVVNTHWHDDHVLGNQAYREAYPGVQFIAHEATKEYLPGRGAAARKSQVENLPGFAAALRDALAQKKNLAGAPITDEEAAGFASDLRMIESYLKDAPSFDVVLPTATVSAPMTLKRGARTIEILQIGRGHTAGDLVVHLPDEGIVAAGDLVVFPIPLVGGDQSHVTDWSATLEKLIAMQAKVIVPGHGPVIRDTVYVRQMAELFTAVTDRVKASVARGETLQQARQSVNLDDFRDKFAGDSQLKRFLFANYVTGPAITSAYRALKQ
jgi:glyoxylase-like metal-dependent hydrolase (beta-lactamase superfamily II)